MEIMEKIFWNESYNIGNELIDKQHQYLVNLINLLVENKNVLSKEELTAIFNNLIHYANVHFQAEEELVSSTDYPNKADHKEEHRKFVKKLEKIELGIVLEDEKSIDNIILFLSQWLIDHILVRDKEFAPFLIK